MQHTTFTAASDRDAIKQFYRRQGFLVIRDALSDSERTDLVTEAIAICRGDRGHLLTPENRSGGRAELPPIPARRELTDAELLRHFLCIHQPHKSSPLIRRTLAHPVIKNALTAIIGPNVKCMQSMLFLKPPGKPGQAWHQDEDYIPTRDRSLCGAWIALDAADRENGCLWVIPGSHRQGILWPQYPHNGPRNDSQHMSKEFPYSEEDAVPVEVPPGAIVFFNGYLLHRSLPNHSGTRYRRVLVNHYMSAESLLPWHAMPDVPVAKTDHRDIVMIAGRDPYAFRGTEEIHQPHLRPAGEGGCGDGRVDLNTFRNRPIADRRFV